ncbi:type II toxin-antitoxin system prevent-host-death family antitoxin [Pseudomonas sp. PDM33]|nr:type II toxin-antitoxin system prevent-host-death family antitoxin [Pseudomonas sp. PDM33]MBV7582142.1 type II toxin-antitoxin system prevent-host-death family antitoxin [Pseudomonas sp. PDM33]
MRVVNFSDARNNLKKVIDDVVDDSDYTVISRRDAPDAVLLSLDSFNSLMETVHLLKSPANAAHLARSLAQMESGKTVVRELVDDEDQPRRKSASRSSTPIPSKPASKKAKAAVKPDKVAR